MRSVFHRCVGISLIVLGTMGMTSLAGASEWAPSHSHWCSAVKTLEVIGNDTHQTSKVVRAEIANDDAMAKYAPTRTLHKELSAVAKALTAMRNDKVALRVVNAPIDNGPTTDAAGRAYLAAMRPLEVTSSLQNAFKTCPQPTTTTISGTVVPSTY